MILPANHLLPSNGNSCNKPYKSLNQAICKAFAFSKVPKVYQNTIGFTSDSTRLCRNELTIILQPCATRHKFWLYTGFTRPFWPVRCRPEEGAGRLPKRTAVAGGLLVRCDHNLSEYNSRLFTSHELMTVLSYATAPFFYVFF